MTVLQKAGAEGIYFPQVLPVAHNVLVGWRGRVAVEECRNMIAARSPQPTMLIVRVAPEPESIHYRAYAERLQDGSVLDWALSRFVASAPRDTKVVCMCEREAERARLQAACSLDKIRFVCVTAPSEVHMCRVLMDAHRVHRLVVARLRHAIAPITLIPSLLSFHDALNAGLIDATLPSCPRKPLFVIDSPTVDVLLTAASPNMPTDVIGAALQLQQTGQKDKQATPNFKWSRVDAAGLCGMPSNRWPEFAGVQSARDAEVIRGALSFMAMHGYEGDRHLITAWKHSSIASGTTRTATSDQRSPLLVRLGRADRVRILYGTNISHFVGAAQSLCHLVDGLDRRRYEPVALVAFEGVLTEELRRRQVATMSPNTDFTEPTADNMRFSQRLLREVQPDIVHANHDIGVALTSAVIGASIPLVQHVRIQTPNAIGLGIHAADAVIAVSDFVRQRVLALDVDPAKVHVILNGVNVEAFRPDPARRQPSRALLGVPCDEFVLAVIARFVRYKRHEIAVTMLGQLRRRIGRGHLLLVGGLEGDREYCQQICDHIAQEGLESHTTRIEFTPHISNVLHASDALALLSTDEALGRVVLEAMAVGLPVIVNDTGGPREVVDSGRTGYVVAHGDIDAAVAALQKLALDPQLATTMGNAAALTVQSQFTSAHCAERTMQLYQQLVNSDRRKLATRVNARSTSSRPIKPAGAARAP